MTTPNPFESTETYATLRRRWLGRYLSVEADVNKKVKAILIEGTKDAESKIKRLGTKSTWSSGVRAAQIRMATVEANAVLHEIFGEIQPVLKRGQRDAAEASIDALTATDRRYLREAFSETSDVNRYIQIERNSAANNVGAAIASLTRSDIPLSRRVYRAEARAKGWVKRDVTIGILRGDSAADIAGVVAKHINPDVPGGVSYAAKRLAVTEINNAFHATTVASFDDRPWIDSVAWNLSNSHNWVGTLNRPVEICELYASKTHSVKSVPRKPHPFCRCFVTPILESVDVFIRHLTAGQYRDWMEKNAA